jgi:phosphate transport system ATP-binding protein
MDKVIVENLTLRYGDAAESLKGINLRIPDNSITVLFGPAGGGKSTFLRVLNRLNDLADVRLLSGKVIINEVNILDPNIDVIQLRRKIGMVFSRPVALPLTIYNNVSYGLEVAGEKRKSVLDDAVERALRQVALWDEIYDRINDPANTLSGGQQQRLCIARVLVLNPEIILLDEPTSALDPISTKKIESLLNDLSNDITIILAPHNTQQSARMADYAAFFLQGEVVEFGPGEKIFVNPIDKRTQDYLAGRFG